MKLGETALEEINASFRSPPDRPPIAVEQIEVFFGANPYSLHPAILCTIRVEPIDIPLAILRERLGTYLPKPFIAPNGRSHAKADAAAVAALAVETAAAMLDELTLEPVASGVIPNGSGPVACWLEAATPSHSIHAIRTALTAISQALAEDESADISLGQLASLKVFCEREMVHFTPQLLTAAARKRNIPFLTIGGHRSLQQFGWGCRSRAFWDSASNGDGLFGFHITRNKHLGKELFRTLGLPAPASVVIEPKQDFVRAAKEIGFPCAVKPLNRGGGKGVSANIATLAELERAVALARPFSERLLLEKHVEGSDHRLLVLDGRLAAAAQRNPPFILGDGRRTVGKMIDAFNATRAGSLRESGYLAPVPNDRALVSSLTNAGVTKETVLPAGTRLLLRSNANRSTGGSAINVLDKVHPQIKRQAELLAQAAGIRAIGIDYITPDIGRTHAEVGGGYIEINCSPGLDVHLATGVSAEQIGALLLGDLPGRVPVHLLLVGSSDAYDIGERLRRKTESCEDFAASAAGWAQLGSLPLIVDTMDALSAATMPLRYPAVHSLTILWTKEDMLHLGLPVDQYASITIFGPAPDEPWLALLHRITDDLRFTDDMSERVEAIVKGESMAEDARAI